MRSSFFHTELIKVCFLALSVVIIEKCENVALSLLFGANVCNTELEARCLPFMCL